MNLTVEEFNFGNYVKLPRITGFMKTMTTMTSVQLRFWFNSRHWEHYWSAGRRDIATVSKINNMAEKTEMIFLVHNFLIILALTMSNDVAPLTSGHWAWLWLVSWQWSVFVPSSDWSVWMVDTWSVAVHSGNWQHNVGNICECQQYPLLCNVTINILDHHDRGEQVK